MFTLSEKHDRSQHVLDSLHASSLATY